MHTTYEMSKNVKYNVKCQYVMSKNTHFAQHEEKVHLMWHSLSNMTEGASVVIVLSISVE